ncbi:heme ABC transporter ATP-binding protein [Halomarina rubra]|uniref:Cobalamin import ATP-binding protein BtuD n=1 Tax=Halomarina rubra TaxID=2071873 RepID=A0ABD6ASP7_9EURY
MIHGQDVTLSLGGARILDDVSFGIESGTFTAVCGPNGAGKTTLLRTVNGALSPDAGRVVVDGEDVATLSAKAIARRVATVPQDTSVAFDFPVRDVVAMGRTAHRGRFERATADDRDAVDRALERAQVTELADRPVGTVSGGERQRVMLARALAQETPALVLDEPTASLDVNHQIRTLSLVRSLVEEGKTALAAIHDLDLAARFCDELLVVADGRVLAAGPPTDVLTEDVVERAFGTRVAVRTNPVTGTPTVTTLGSGTHTQDLTERSVAPSAHRPDGGHEE